MTFLANHANHLTVFLTNHLAGTSKTNITRFTPLTLLTTSHSWHFWPSNLWSKI